MTHDGNTMRLAIMTMISQDFSVVDVLLLHRDELTTSMDHTTPLVDANLQHERSRLVTIITKF